MTQTGIKRANVNYDVERIRFWDNKINRRVSSQDILHHIFVLGKQNDWNIRHNPF